MNNHIEYEIQPVPGAARYFANMDSKKNKYAVWMVIDADEHCQEKRYYTLSHHNSFLSARKASNKWQKKENKSVLKHHPELSKSPITSY